MLRNGMAHAEMPPNCVLPPLGVVERGYFISRICALVRSQHFTPSFLTTVLTGQMSSFSMS
jgi:hypothetical protein